MAGLTLVNPEGTGGIGNGCKFEELTILEAGLNVLFISVNSWVSVWSHLSGDLLVVAAWNT